METLVRTIPLALAALSVIGCANQSTVANSNAGTTRVFSYPYEQVRPAAVEAVQGLRVELKGTQPDGEGVRILFSKAVSAWSWGEVGSVLVKPVAENTTLVTVDTEKRSRLQVTGTDEKEFSAAIFSGIEQSLARGK